MAKQRALVLALLASLILWNLPFGGLLLYPFKLLATWLHESSHGLVMLITGAGFDRMEIYRDTSGLAYMRHGIGAPGAAAIAAAGYMGTPVFGALFLVVGQTRRGARSVLFALGGLLGLSAALFVSNTFGIAAMLTATVACFALALFVHENVAVFLVNFIAAQACINAVLDIRVLFRANLVVNGHSIGASDAHNMAHASFGTPTMWAVTWMAWSLVCFFAALRLVYVRQRRTDAAETAASDQMAVPEPVPVIDSGR